MKRLLSIVAAAGLTASASAAWVWNGYVTSGIAGDAGVFGLWVAVSGDRVVVSDGVWDAFAFDALTGTRYSLATPTWARGVAVTGNAAFVAGNDESYRFSRSSSTGLWSGPSTDTGIVGAGYDAAADGNLAIVSSDVSSSSGIIKVYEKISGSWTTSTNFGLIDGHAGWSVAIDDLLDIYFVGPPPVLVSRNGRMIIGAPTEDITGYSGAGIAKVYEQSGSSGTWSLAATLTDPSPSANDLFGMDVAIAGSYAFVADHDPAGGPGVVHVYKRVSGTWSWSATLSIPTGRYGQSIAAYSDRLLVGMPGDPGVQGQAILYRRSGSAYAYEANLTLAGVHENHGTSVALTKDRAVVGGDESGGAGRVHIFTGP